MPGIAGMTLWKEFEMKRVSIVIPVYNSEAYLAETLESVAAQTYTDIEVILVDDGSTDKSGQICEEMAERDARFRYYRVENGGPSTARNIGISYATGEYIGFCDSDDLIDPSMYQTMVAYMEQHSADIVFCDIYSERDQRRFGFPWSDGTVFQGDEIGQTLVAAFVGNESDNAPDIPLWGSVVRCLFKADVIESRAVSFPDDIHFAEDLVFTLQYLREAERAVICDRAFYYYRCNSASIMNSFFSYKRGMFCSRKRLIEYISQLTQGYSNRENLHRRLNVTSRCYFRECIGNACRPEEGRTEAEKRRELQEILNDKGVMAAFAEFDAKDLRMKIIYSLIKYRLAFVIRMYYSFRFYRRSK